MPFSGAKPFASVPVEDLLTEEFARKEDEKDPLSRLRNEFLIPTKGDLRHKRYGPKPTNMSDEPEAEERQDDAEEAIYLCGNSLGLQPRRTRENVLKYLDTWASKGVYGHFKELEDGLPPWLHLDDAVKEQTAKIVGAETSEVVVMQTLTANLHLLLASFYRPTKDRYKIIIEGKAFPSDHYAALSQLAHHNIPPSALITIDPPSPSSPILTTAHILSIISEHAATTALVLLPGIQFYSGQFFDVEIITHHCHRYEIPIGWDLAHAVGNVPLQLHKWDVDFAAWCNYKYMNGGPGVIGGLFVHEKHGEVAEACPRKASGECTNDGCENGDEKACSETMMVYKPRLSGWWGSDKSSRFAMENRFVPIPGASGFQLSNPSALDMTSVLSSLEVFAQTNMEELRQRSVKLTAYLERLLLFWKNGDGEQCEPPYKIITPSNPAERGAQLSVLLKPGLLEKVQEYIEERGVVADERKPDVIRIAPAPLYNSYWDVYRFIVIFHEACQEALASKESTKVDAEGADGEALPQPPRSF